MLQNSSDTTLDNIHGKEFLKCYEILTRHIQRLNDDFGASSMFDGEILEVPDPKELSDPLLESVLLSQFTKLLPFILQHLGTEDKVPEIELTPDLEYILRSQDVTGELDLSISDFIRGDVTGDSVFSCWYKGKIYMQCVFDGDKNFKYKSYYFYSQNFIFEYRSYLDSETRTFVYTNDLTILQNNLSKERATTMSVRISPEGRESTYLRRSVGFFESMIPGFDLDIIEEVFDIRNPTARRIRVFDLGSEEEVMTMNIFKRVKEKDYSAITELATLTEDDETNETVVSISRTIKILQTLFEETAEELVKGQMGHGLLFRGIKRGNIEKGITTFLYVTSFELGYHELEIHFSQWGGAVCIRLDGIEHRISGFSKRANNFVLYLGSFERFIMYKIDSNGFPIDIKMSGIIVKPRFKNPKKSSRT